MIRLPDRVPKKPKETGLVGQVLLHLQRIDGVRPLRNNNGVLTDVRGIPVRYGLGNGSPDVVVGITIGGKHSALYAYRASSPVCFAFGVELKMPGKTRSPDQIAWHAVAKEYGMSVDTAWTVEEACAQARGEIARIDRWLGSLCRST